MRHLLLLPLFLLLPTEVSAAEKLSNSSLDKTYIPQTSPCLPKEEKDKPAQKDCGLSPTTSLTDKALRDAEQQARDRELNDANRPTPSLSPPPPPSVTPEQHDIILRFERLTEPGVLRP